LHSVQDTAMSTISEVSALYLYAGTGSGPLNAAKVLLEIKLEVELAAGSKLPWRGIKLEAELAVGIKLEVEFPDVDIKIEFGAIVGPFGKKLPLGLTARGLDRDRSNAPGGGATAISCMPPGAQRLPALPLKLAPCAITPGAPPPCPARLLARKGAGANSMWKLPDC